MPLCFALNLRSSLYLVPFAPFPLRWMAQRLARDGCVSCSPSSRPLLTQGMVYVANAALPGSGSLGRFRTAWRPMRTRPALRWGLRAVL